MAFMVCCKKKGAQQPQKMGRGTRDYQPGMAYIIMAYVVMAYIIMAYVVMAYVVMAYVVMAYVVMAYVVMAYMRLLTRHGLYN